MPRELSVVAGALAGICLLFFVYPAPLIDLAAGASQALIDMPAPEALLTGLFGPAEIR